jgi:hypothetical protein
MNCALTAPEQIIAMMTAGSDRVEGEVMITVGFRAKRVADAPEPHQMSEANSSYHPATRQTWRRRSADCVPHCAGRVRVRIRGSESLQESWTEGESREFGVERTGACVSADRCFEPDSQPVRYGRSSSARGPQTVPYFLPQLHVAGCLPRIGLSVRAGAV